MPFVTLNCRTKENWVNSELLSLIRERYIAKKNCIAAKSKFNPNSDNTDYISKLHDDFKKLRIQVKNVIHSSRGTYIILEKPKN